MIPRLVGTLPGIASWKIKQKNPYLLGGVAEGTVSDYLKMNLDYRSCRTVPKLWVTRAHHVKRLAFAIQYKDWALDERCKLLLTSEANYVVNDNQRVRVYPSLGT